MLKYFPFGIVRVVGTSMIPTLQPGQYVVVSSLPYCFGKPCKDDLVVALVNGRKIIKRVWAGINGRYDLRGDNLAESTDSRSYGTVKRAQILGKVIYS